MKNYINALLSDISYIQFESNTPIDLNLNLQNAIPRNISAVEVEFFNNNFKIIDQFANNPSGFSATTFQATKDIYFDGEIKYKQGSIIIANRGTEPSNFGNDFITDGIGLIDSTIAGFILNISPLKLDALFTDGLIFGTIRDLLGNVLGNDRLFSVNQTKDADVYLKNIYAKFSENDPNFKLSVTGHSLGGHLAFSSAITNPSMVNSSYTYNAAGIDFVSTFFLKFKEAIITNYGENPTMIKNVDDFLNLENLGPLLENSFGFYNDVGIEFTTLEGLLRHPENRISMVTEDMRNRQTESFMALHSVKYLREISIVYEVMSTLLNDKSYSSYPKITEIINNYKIESYTRYYNAEENTLVNFILRNIVDYTGMNIPAVSEYGIKILEAISGTSATLKDYKNISASTNDSLENRANIYALLNLVPFVIYSDKNKLQSDIYDGSSYSQEFLNSRESFLKKVMTFSNRTDSYNILTNIIDIPIISDMLPSTIYKGNVIVEINNGNSKNIYIDLANKTVIFENTNREEVSSNFSIPVTVFLSTEAKSFLIDHKNSKLFDSFGDDSVVVLNSDAEIFLTSGNDTITVDMIKGGSIKSLNIKDDGIGDIIILSATNDTDSIVGTQYNDTIIGLDNSDILNGGAGDDQIYGDLNMSSVSNYTGPIILGNDIIDGGDGNDKIYGGTGNDILNGGNGNDIIYGNYTDSNLADENILSDKFYTNTINGGQGIDIIRGGEGSDIINNVSTSDMSYINLTSEQFTDLKNKSAVDTLFGDNITGGKGNDVIYGTQYGDKYYYNSGDGNDKIYERNIGVGTNEFIDRIYIKSDFSNFSFAHNNTSDLTIKDKTTNQSIVFYDFMRLKYVEEFVFYNENQHTIYTYDVILNIVLNRTTPFGLISFLNGNNQMDLSHVETLSGIGGLAITNNINGGYGKNIINGGNNKDIINKSYVNGALDASKDYGDYINAGKGDDDIYGTNYGDTYLYNLGDGFDKIYESTLGNPTNVNLIDKIVFGTTISSSYITFEQLAASVIVLYNNIKIIQLVDFMTYQGIEQMCFADSTILTKFDILARIPKIDPTDPTKITGTDFGETLTGTDGNDTINAGAGDDIINGGKGDDRLYGDDGNDTINGGIGNDKIYGGNGNDILNGNEGNDEIYGGNGNDTLNGNEGADILYGDDGDDKINGGGGLDTIYGGNGNDTINKGEQGSGYIVYGGKNNDEIYGSFGNDTYHYTYGDGNDTIYETATNETYIDLLYLHEISPDDVEIYRKGISSNDIYITIKSSGEYIIIKNYYENMATTNYLDQIIFDNGTIWKSEKIKEQAKHYRGTEGNDTITVSNSLLINIIDSGGGSDTIRNSIQGTVINSGDGDDFISSSGNDAIIKSGNGKDTITASGSNIVVESGSGIDTITSTMSGTINSGLDNDKIYLGDLKETIIYNIGDGQDTVYTNGSGNDVFNIGGYNKVDKNNLYLSGRGKVLELRFNGVDSINLNNYLTLLSNINNAMTFNFDNGIMSNTELKDLYTIINKAEIADNKFYDTVAADQITGTDGDDNINIINGNGGTGFDIVNAGNGIDIITNEIDNSVITAGNDNDIIYTYGNNVTINGDSGNDNIYVTPNYIGSGYLGGGSGNDTFIFSNSQSTSNNYIIEGGLGNDVINMSYSLETIIFNRGDGSDTINISGSNSESQTDKLIIKGYSKNDINFDSFYLSSNGASVTLKLSENDSIKLVNFLYIKDINSNLKYFEFDDGILTNKELIEKMTHIKGTNGTDIIYDTIFDDTIDMIGRGLDTVYLKSGNDILNTGEESTSVRIQSSYNIINSGSGNDSFYIDLDSINTFNLKSSNNGHDSIGFAYLNTNGIINVNINKTINIADTKNGYLNFSWGNESSLSFQSIYLNNRIIFNNQPMNLEDINLVGDDADNYLSAISSKGQTIYGNGGKDEIYGTINNDIIYGGLGNDKIYGQGGNDALYGDDGDDWISGLKGDNNIYGGEGNDTIYIGTGNDIVYGGNGNDYIESVSGLSGLDIIYGGDGDDTIKANPYYGEFYGQNGNDTYKIYKGLVEDHSGNNSLTIQSTDYNTSDIRKTSTGFQVFKGDEVLVDYIGIANKIEINYPSGDGYGYYTSLIGSEINKLFELQASLTYETEHDNSAQKINELKSQMNYLWRTDTQ